MPASEPIKEEKENIKKEEEPKADPKEEPKAEAKKPLMEQAMQSIESLKSSNAFIQARDDMVLKEAPNNFYQYERDIKSLKNDKEMKLKYLLNIQPNNYKNIFKSDLEADTMLNIFSAYLEQDNEFFKTNAEYLSGVLAAIQSVQPFELSCDFLMDDEKDIIKNLVNNICKHFSGEQINEVKAKFSKVCDIDF